MKKAILVMMLAALAAPLWAQDLQLPPGRWWENPQVTERIGLTAEQQAQLHDLVFGHARRMIDLNAAIKKQELDLKELVDQPQLDVKAVRQAFAGLQQARQRLESERFELLLGVRQALTPQQWEKLRRLRDEVREHRMMRQEPPGGMGPQGPGAERPQRMPPGPAGGR